MENHKRRPEDERHARAVARRRKKRRQQRIILGFGFVLILAMVVGGIFGVCSLMKNKERNSLRTQGIAAMEGGEYEKAIVMFDQALEGSKGKIGRFETDVLSYRGEAEFEQKDYEAAKYTFTLLKEKHGKTEVYKRLLCLCELELGNYDAALSYGFINGRVYNKMAIEDIDNKDYDSALANINKGLEEADESTIRDLRFNEAVVYEHKSDYKKALELLEAYVAVYGTDEAIDREITFLKTRQGNQ